MIGEEVKASAVTERGLLGDRAYALFDPITGKVVSAKNPKKWAKMFEFHATFMEQPRLKEAMPPVRIECPDGSNVRSDRDDVGGVLSKVLGREVRFVTSAPERPSLEEYWPDIEGLARRDKVTDEAMPTHTFFDLATVHLLTTATLDRLRELYPAGRFEVRRFRPNFLLQAAKDSKGFVEDGWVGSTVTIGDEVRLRVTGPCPRCVMTTLSQGELPSDPGILRTAAKHHQVNVGVYATVLHGGEVHRGDALAVV